ncbi:hypothetical protein CRE_11668 [Caenorhabditis remanei]|uniref:Arrestin-like N-terminal domain-containing protein n=1 Tax=Caenorhabditis remanei TaxID=31234 RepID=E3M406_CAERE|nr:hypothetical protein CRE_11668 [Caenorhabditis remanei]
MPETELHVEFDQPQEVFFPGHPISGRVVLLTEDKYKAKTVNCNGFHETVSVISFFIKCVHFTSLRFPSIRTIHTIRPANFHRLTASRLLVSTLSLAANFLSPAKPFTMAPNSSSLNSLTLSSLPI